MQHPDTDAAKEAESDDEFIRAMQTNVFKGLPTPKDWQAGEPVGDRLARPCM